MNKDSATRLTRRDLLTYSGVIPLALGLGDLFRKSREDSAAIKQINKIHPYPSDEDLMILVESETERVTGDSNQGDDSSNTQQNSDVEESLRRDATQQQLEEYSLVVAEKVPMNFSRTLVDFSLAGAGVALLATGLDSNTEITDESLIRKDPR